MAAFYPAIDMAGYPIKPLWGFVLQIVSILANLFKNIIFICTVAKLVNAE